MQLLDCLEHTPGGPVHGSVIWLHGLGASGYDFAPIVPQLGLEGVRFVFPHAPPAAVTINQGHVMPSWYDVRSLDHASPDREDEADVRASAKRVQSLVDREVARGVPRDRILLAGFSQGAGVALFTGLRADVPYLGVICLSGYLLVARSLDAEVTDGGRATPMFFGHGREDDVVPLASGRAAFEAAQAKGVSATWKDYPMGHNVNPQELRDVRAFLHARFGSGS